jgi:O-antigen/teichoic acid export membrane protein
MTVAVVSAAALPLLPRLWLSHISYAQVGFIDVALLAYTVPQRVTGAVFAALVPHASAASRDRNEVRVPSRADVGVVLCGLVAIDALLWTTGGLTALFRLVGLSSYTPAVHLILILVLAVPAELSYAVNSAVLSGFGESRRLAAATGAVSAVTCAAMAGAAALGATYVAALLVCAFWALDLAARRLLPPSCVTSSLLTNRLVRLTPSNSPARVFPR